MKLCERVAVISEENMEKLLQLYGTMDLDDLFRIVNNHLQVAIEEIEEDCKQHVYNSMDLIITDKKGLCIDLAASEPVQEEKYMSRVTNCKECEYARMYDYGKRIYYCDHTDRIDDMGKLGADNLTETIPEWCPVKEKE